jgi:prolipoprotein diacylglyceryl transferase
MHCFIPTPSHSAVELGPFTIHYYAICILVGIIAAVIIGRRRYRSIGGDSDVITDVAITSIPAGIIGGRIYHVVTSPDGYFGAKGHPLDALKIWDGGMGIWGAIALGTIAAFLTFRRVDRGTSFSTFADALAPGILVAQAIGRWGNWFNGELFGRPTTAPWGLEIPRDLRPLGFSDFATFHPTFLYESLWCLMSAVILLLLSKRRSMAPGNLFILYITLYCGGRCGIEYLRIDDAHHLWGLRLNEWVSAIGFFLSLFAFSNREKRAKKVKM